MKSLVVMLCLVGFGFPAMGQRMVLSLVKGGPQQGWQPVKDNFATQADTIRFLTPGASPIFVYRVKSDFQAAFPPMQTQLPPSGKAELTVDSLFSVSANADLQLPLGLYFAQLDTTTLEGIGFLITDRAYPKLRKIDDVLAALVYISTNEEIEEIRRSSDKKATLDRYWLRLGGNEENARRMIRLFYQRVEHANRHFTTYKEGWKTDKGMIYIVFGEPTHLNRNARGEEEWEYRLQGRTLKFTFQPKANQFTGVHYELVRHARYRDPWYEYVDRWRNGLVAN